MKIFHLALLTAALTIAACTDAKDDKVETLEGYMNFTGKFDMYSGYLTIQEQPKISLHYVFITSLS